MIVGLALIWVSFFSVSDMPSWLDFKPFNCVICISFWTCLIASLIIIMLPFTEPYIHALCWGGIGAYSAIVLNRIMFKI